MSRAPQDRPDIQVFAEIAAIDQLATTRIERALPAGLTKAQFMVLDRLARRGGGETPAELARAFQLTKGALTNSLTRLAAAGLIVVVGDKDDARKKRATVTDAGARRIARRSPRSGRLPRARGKRFPTTSSRTPCRSYGP